MLFRSPPYAAYYQIPSATLLVPPKMCEGFVAHSARDGKELACGASYSQRNLPGVDGPWLQLCSRPLNLLGLPYFGLF